MQGFCSVYFCLYIHRGNGKADFLPFICSGFCGVLVVWFAAASGGGLVVGVGSCFSEFERITLFQIRAYSLENRGYFTLFRGFRWAIFVTSGSSIHTQLKTVLPTSHLHPTTYPNGLPNGKTQIPSLSPYPPPNSNYLKTKPYTTNTSLLHNNYINLK